MAFAIVSGICGRTRFQVPAMKSGSAGMMSSGRGISRNGGIPCVAIPAASPMMRTRRAEMSGIRVRCDAMKKATMTAIASTATSGSATM